MPHQKLLPLLQLVKEQVLAGHLEPSVSPHNSPVSVIQKKTTNIWQLLQDLRQVNAHLQKIGSPQTGLLHPSAITQGFHIIAVNIKDCFFPILLHEADRPFFAFSVPVPNNAYPLLGYQWTVLPQGMKNIQLSVKSL